MSVSKEVEKKGQSRIALKVSVGGEQTAAVYQKNLDKYRKNAEIRGFRRGKVPTSVLESKFGKFIREESKADLLNEALTGLWQADPSIAPLAEAEQDLAAEHDLAPGEDYTFETEYDVMPEVALPDLASYVIPTPQFDVSEEMVAEELKTIQQRNALAIDTSAPAVAGDFVTLEVAFPCHHHHDDDHAHKNKLVVEAGDESDPSGLGARIVGVAANQSFELEGEDAKALCAALQAEEATELSVVCKKVKRHDLPAIDDELAQDVSEDFQNLEDLKEAIRKNLRRQGEEFIATFRLKKFYREWLKNAEISLPQTLEKHARQRAAAALLKATHGEQEEDPHVFQRQLEMMLAESSDELTKAVGEVTKRIWVELLRGAIAKEQQFTVEADELATAAEEMTQNVYHCSLQEFSELAGPGAVESLRSGLEDRLLADKIDKYLLKAMGDKDGERVDLKQLREMASRSYVTQSENATSSPD